MLTASTPESFPQLSTVLKFRSGTRSKSNLQLVFDPRPICARSSQPTAATLNPHRNRFLVVFFVRFWFRGALKIVTLDEFSVLLLVRLENHTERYLLLRVHQFNWCLSGILHSTWTIIIIYLVFVYQRFPISLCKVIRTLPTCSSNGLKNGFKTDHIDCRLLWVVHVLVVVVADEI